MSTPCRICFNLGPGAVYLCEQHELEFQRWLAVGRPKYIDAGPKPRYEVQQGERIEGLRISDMRTDSRVATCYDPGNAELVCAALNLLAMVRPTAGDSTADYPFWLVACTETNPGRNPRVELLTRPPRFVHDEEKSAEAEAVRLATLHKGFEFAVLGTIAVAKWNGEQKRVVWEEVADVLR